MPDASVSRGALYTTLDRLEQKGLLRSRLGDPLPERGGRARRYYTVSPRGLASLRAARESIDGLSAGRHARTEAGAELAAAICSRPAASAPAWPQLDCGLMIVSTKTTGPRSKTPGGTCRRSRSDTSAKSTAMKKRRWMALPSARRSAANSPTTAASTAARSAHDG